MVFKLQNNTAYRCCNITNIQHNECSLPKLSSVEHKIGESFINFFNSIYKPENQIWELDFNNYFQQISQ